MHSCHTNPSTPDAVFCAVQRPGSPAMLLSLERQLRVSATLLRSNGLRNKSDRTWVPTTQKTALPVLWTSYTSHGRKRTASTILFGTEQQRWLTKETEICHSVGPKPKKQRTHRRGDKFIQINWRVARQNHVCPEMPHLRFLERGVRNSTSNDFDKLARFR